jgi:hypothetical protein
LRKETGERKLEAAAARARGVAAMAFAGASEQEEGRQGALLAAHRWVEEKGRRDRVGGGVGLGLISHIDEKKPVWRKENRWSQMLDEEKSVDEKKPTGRWWRWNTEHVRSFK